MKCRRNLSSGATSGQLQSLRLAVRYTLARFQREHDPYRSPRSSHAAMRLSHHLESRLARLAMHGGARVGARRGLVTSCIELASQRRREHAARRTNAILCWVETLDIASTAAVAATSTFVMALRCRFVRARVEDWDGGALQMPTLARPRGQIQKEMKTFIARAESVSSGWRRS